MIKDLLNKLDRYKDLDAIIVEGYDGVGKGTVLNAIAEHYGIIPYRPDYNLWQQFDHRKVDRWKVSGFFWDVYSHFFKGGHNFEPMLFDRGVISGAVYNDDMEIAYRYKDMIRDQNLLHILVNCSYADYYTFYRMRNPEIPEDDIRKEYEKCVVYTNRYIEALESAEVNYIIYINEYDDKISGDVCRSCGHYSYGICRHPKKNCIVNGDQQRCELSTEREVQDIVN